MSTKVFCEYASLGAFAQEMETAPTSRLFLGKDLSSQRTGSSFYGTPNWETACKLLRDGDTKSAELLTRNGVIRCPKRTNQNRAINYASVVGFMPHIPNLVAGLPNAMISQRQIIVKRKVITIVLCIGVACDWSAQEISKVSANVVNAIREVEAFGVRVNLYMGEFSHANDESYGVVIKLKDSGKYLEPFKMGYPLVNPSMLRRHMFRWLETRNEFHDERWTRTYGAVTNLADIKALLNEKHFMYQYCTSLQEMRHLDVGQIKGIFLEK